MSRRRPSEKPEKLVFGPLGPRTLKEVYQYIDFGPVRAELRETCLTSLLTLARLHATLVDEPPLTVLARIPTNVPLLRNYLNRSHAKRQNYTDGGWRNMRHGVFASLREAGVKVRSGRRRIKLSYEWQRLLDLLPEKLLRIIYPFARWTFEEGLEPQQVTIDVASRYQKYLEEFDGRKNRREAFVVLLRAWRLATNTISDWPKIALKFPTRYDRYLLAWSAFGPALEWEVSKLMQAAMHPDPLQPRRRKRIRSTTAKHQTYQLQRIASALVNATGCDPKSITSVRQLVEPTAARATLRFLTARAHKRQQQQDF